MDDARQLISEGVQLFKDGKLEEAIVKLKAAVDADPSNVQAHSYLGAAYARDGQHPASVEQFQAAVDLDPQNPVHTFNLGQAFETSGNKARAKMLYEKALALDPKYAKAKQKVDALTGGPAAAAQAAAPLTPQAQAPAPAQTASVPSAPPPPWQTQPQGPQPPGGPGLYGGPQAPPTQYGAPQRYDPALGLGARSAGNWSYASGLKRFAAAFIDGLILGAVGGAVWLAMKPAAPLAQAAGGQVTPQQMTAAIQQMIASMRPVMMVNGIVGLLYFVGFNTALGQTPGKMALGIRILRTDGSKIGLGTALFRYILQSILANITCGLAYIAIPINAQKRGLHDQIVDTMVVEG